MSGSEITVPAEGSMLSALWSEAPDSRAVAVVAHGANNDMRHPFFEGVALGLVDERISVLRFNFPYRNAGRGYPDRPPVLTKAWRHALEEARLRAGESPVVASGKSLGGRMASVLAAEDPEGFGAEAIVFFAYPLHAPGRPERLRDAHLDSIRVPMLLIQGTADPLARFDLIENVARRLGGRATLRVVEGGDHSFRVRGRKRPDEEIGRELGGMAAAWIGEEVHR